ncbi:hypothetical protein AVEN_79417-1 [Araneus ventricosus]|uniref:Uncharacterized protein n=1 Tax=Araneus ventricosus TaxID=182803 RepID=A0A4Y2RDR6_ARAVE|nr:hypothetical protein AVEN_79417-1 [Araneus ventricosus]
MLCAGCYSKTGNRKPSLPRPASVSKSIEERSLRQLDTDVRVLTAITDHSPTSSQGGTYLHQSGVTQYNTITMPTREARARLIIRILLSHVFVVPNLVDVKNW